MMSLGVKPGKKIDHTCKSGENHTFFVKDDYTIDSSARPPIHRIYLVKDNLNKNIEAGIYKLMMK